MAGICAGVRGKTNPGDVLFVDPSWDWQSGKRSKDATSRRQFLLAPHQLTAPSKIRAHVEQLRGDRQALNEISAAWGEDIPNQLRIVIGPVASGSAVLADGEIVEEVREQHRELIGIEMEAYGLYAAANMASEPRPSFFAMKAVCDFGDPAKNDVFQRYAAYTSANCIRLLFERFSERLLRS